MKHLGVKLSLYLNYFVFAILLNSVGTVILQVQRNYDITKDVASILEGFKDIPIAIVSFFLASQLPKFGLKRSMQLGLLLVGTMCLVMPFTNDFWYFKLLFLTVGVSFALIKVTVFATIGLITDDTQEHSSFMSSLEGVFMIGVLLGNVVFSLFIDDADPKSTFWLSFYYVLSALSLIAFLILTFTSLDESPSKIESRSPRQDFIAMLKLIALPLVIVFIVSVFLFVLIEQSFQTWTPTFYKDLIAAPARMSVQAGAVLAGAFAIGRFAAGAALKYVHWFTLVVICILGSASLVLISLPLAQGVNLGENVTWLNAPIVAYIFPLMGVFLAPIYPTINSVVLSSLPKHSHSSMSGLIVVFSALGGTLGSVITGNVFEFFDGSTAFYASLVPMTLLLGAVILFNRLKKKNAVQG
ncbi:MFS transporter [Dokdonia sinensis]|uniref:MFS transporter n=1 Tax=Dokdonia sinensis TaxID=2479847 RepID=A0A3M0G4B3_9FLAO|nr:MFS transporter [Dokdonia sinensis]RMB56753.1 MFS transporter [Dokdonia sinensis]